MCSQTTARAGLVITLVLGALSVQGLPVVAADHVVEVSGRLVQVMSEEAADDSDHIHVDDDVDMVTMVEVDGDLIALPDPVEGATGDEVVVTIEGSGRSVGAEALAAAVDESNPATVLEIEVLADGPDGTLQAAGSKNTLTILPVYWSGSPSVSTAALKTLGDATATYWSQQSGGSITTSVVVKPWIDARTTSAVSVPTSCSNAAMATLVSQVMAANGYKAPSGTTGRVSLFFPYWSVCGWAGLGSVGGAYSWINGYSNPEILAHEFGHNLGLGHANRFDCGRSALVLPTSSCAGREYGDTVDVMGSGTLTGKPGNLNAAMADFLGLAKVVKAQPDKSTTATLAPLGSVGSVRAMTVPVSGGTVYVSFRPNVSPDTRQPSWAGVQVHMQVMDSYFPVSYLLDMHPDHNFAYPTLGVGERWQIPGTGLELVVDSISGMSSAKVTVAPIVKNELPIGNWEQATGASGEIRLSGWVLDPDRGTDPSWVLVFVDGQSQGLFTADQDRPDVGRAFGKGDKHGFSVTLSASEGRHDVCVFAANWPWGGTNPLLGCRVVTVTNALPIGNWEQASATSGAIHLSGWVLDPDRGKDPSWVLVFVDGGYLGLFTADQDRPDVGRAFGKGDKHGFSVTLSASRGRHDVCVFAANWPWGGTNPLLGCRVVTVP